MLDKLLVDAASEAGAEVRDGFARVNDGVMSPAEFFSDENIGRIVATARQRPAD